MLSFSFVPVCVKPVRLSMLVSVSIEALETIIVNHAGLSQYEQSRSYRYWRQDKFTPTCLATSPGRLYVSCLFDPLSRPENQHLLDMVSETAYHPFYVDFASA